MTTPVHRVYINAAPERVWEANPSPEWNGRYGYRAVSEYDLKPGGQFRAIATPTMQDDFAWALYQWQGSGPWAGVGC